jgi:hypothetical protein
MYSSRALLSSSTWMLLSLTSVLKTPCCEIMDEPLKPECKYYVSGHYPSSCLYLKTVPFIFQNTTFRRLDCLHLQVKPTQLGQINRTSPYLRTRRWIMSKNIIFVLMYHILKLLDLIKAKVQPYGN